MSNLRYLTGWRDWLGVNLSRYRLVRRLIGGRWELWWVDVVYSAIWHPVTCSSPGHRPTPICRGEALSLEVWP